MPKLGKRFKEAIYCKHFHPDHPNATNLMEQIILPEFVHLSQNAVLRYPSPYGQVGMDTYETVRCTPSFHHEPFYDTVEVSYVECFTISLPM
jgi:hypothetical protein